MAEVFVFLVSLSAVIVGADWLGNAATYFAKKLSLPKILIGATFVSIATTGPEIVIAFFSGIGREPAIGLGTALGSPLVNIGLILGLLLFFSKARVDEPHYTRTIQIFLLVLATVFFLSITGTITPISGFALFLVGIFYLLLEFFISKNEQGIIEGVESRFWRLKSFFSRKNNLQVFYFIAGAILLLGGAHFLVGSAATIAAIFGIPEIVIGFVAIAFGTSLPELFFAVNAILRRRTELSVGNLFGASILDLTLALGLIGILGGFTVRPYILYLTIGTAALLSILALSPVFGKFRPKVIGIISIAIYFGFLIWFGKVCI
ncbi:MAG: hypothetical protein A2172_03610 [Candidatus Woykebacteria bacterium RBG_13_40_15]|uniref:Sodium/calcium exchanger membrane region domain-containing protein n=1 Tax=Candidatus Woykebacteria bacterium RBG_13_40_15 TaxID=1802593 RepID=A0A1G1W5T4_9BACT|nr:MAG: hypothetical protein A2172_03610 [Candidatus Woykebacteria bacterium RBG_13_40_15]